MLEICMHYSHQHFYGVCEGTLGICGAEGILFTSNSHYLSFKGILCNGSNNLDGFWSLMLHMRIAL